MNCIYPPDRVLVCNSEVREFIPLDSTHYKRTYSESQLQEILFSLKKKNLFNGTCIRMDSLSDGKCYLSKVGFYDFLASNLLNSSVRACKMDSFDAILDEDSLANVVAVSILLECSEGDLLLVKRDSSVAVSSGIYGVSATGSLEEYDLLEPNPFLSCANRELKEELNLSVELMCTGIVAGKQKLQPVVLFYGKLSVSCASVLNSIRQAKDFCSENAGLFAVPKWQVVDFMHSVQMTDIAAYQLFCVVECTSVEWLSTMAAVSDSEYSLEEYRIL